jgi:hypothetical protein
VLFRSKCPSIPIPASPCCSNFWLMGRSSTPWVITSKMMEAMYCQQAEEAFQIMVYGSMISLSGARNLKRGSE